MRDVYLFLAQNKGPLLYLKRLPVKMEAVAWLAFTWLGDGNGTLVTVQAFQSW